MVKLDNFYRIERALDEIHFYYENDTVMMVYLLLDTENRMYVGGEHDELLNETVINYLEIEKIEIQCGDSNPIKFNATNDQIDQFYDTLVEFIKSGKTYVDFRETA